MTFQPYAQPIVLNPRALDPDKIQNADLNKMTDKQLELEFEYTDRRCTDLVVQMERSRMSDYDQKATPLWRLRELYTECYNRYKDIVEEMKFRYIP